MPPKKSQKVYRVKGSQKSEGNQGQAKALGNKNLPNQAKYEQMKDEQFDKLFTK